MIEKKVKLKIVSSERGKPMPINEEDLDVLDWDFYLENPPEPHYSGTVKLKFKNLGRGKPVPVDYEESFKF